MTVQDESLEYWTSFSIDELPERFPDHISLDDGPFEWQNMHTDTMLYIDYRPTPELWALAGSNSVISEGDTLSDVQDAAREYM